LNSLKNASTKDLKEKGPAENYEKVRGKVLKALKPFARTLKSDDLDFLRNQDKFRKKVLKLAGDLIGLDAKHVTTVDDGKDDTETEGNEGELLKLLNDVKVPEGDDEDVSFDDDDEQQEQPATAPPQQQQQQPTAAPSDGSAVMKRLNALAPY